MKITGKRSAGSTNSVTHRLWMYMLAKIIPAMAMMPATATDRSNFAPSAKDAIPT